MKINSKPMRHRMKPLRLWLTALEVELGLDNVLYLIRQLYSVVFTAYYQGADKETLAKVIAEFERDNDLPDVLTYFPIKQFLMELEDVQYIYFPGKKPVTIPFFK